MNERKNNPSGLPYDLEILRARLNRPCGQRSWRSLEELIETPEWRELRHREFAAGASEWPADLNRRNFFKLAGATVALAGLTACTKQPAHEILPYVNQPEGLVPGEPLFYATSMVLAGFATGLLVKSREGHPVKIEGNPDHPSSLGASSIWMQASLLDLYDPDRSRSVTYRREISSWGHFLSELNDLVRNQTNKQGQGLHFLTGTVTSPTLASQLRELARAFPKSRWHQFEPVSRDNIREGARMAFGEFAETHYRFDKAHIILALDSDFLCTHPERLRHARDFSEARRAGANNETMSRLYAAESSPTITGAMADHRLPIESRQVENLARLIARRLEILSAPAADLSRPQEQRWLEWLLRDLQSHRGNSIVVAGEWQPPIVHALAHLLNQELNNVGSTVRYTESAEAAPINQPESFRGLVDQMKNGEVDALFILGGNPAYDSPADLGFAEHLAKVKHSIHLGLHLDETSALCDWHIPQNHYLESWSDARAFDGTVSLVQPLIAPLYTNGKSTHELLGALLQQQPVRGDYEIVRDHWRSEKIWLNFEKGWRSALHDGLIHGTDSKAKTVRVTASRLSSAIGEVPGPFSSIELNLRPDPNVWDGRFAGNGWLQECPRPLTKLTWDNALLISPALAQQERLTAGDIVEILWQKRTLRAPVWIMPGQAENSITLHLGYGRTRGGQPGRGVGVNAYPIRVSDAAWGGSGAQLSKTGQHHNFASTQSHHHLDNPERQIHRTVNWSDFRSNPGGLKETVDIPSVNRTLLNPLAHVYNGYNWGMSIDLTTCIGCNACLVACALENNIPVVGKDQVSRHREMSWIRIDTWYQGNLDNPEFHQMPVPCMHCQEAPCELVCPVGATVHDHEGLNVQVYNRCIGTRYCSNNCPYKVRRFNFYQYTDYVSPSLKPMYNPDVTVRWRGVMEKCTYCIQRISRARITAEKENRTLTDGEVVTACQQACPAQAIVFGDLSDPNSRVSRLKSNPLDYPMLGTLNTRPRTTYLAKLRNPAATEADKT